MLDQAPLSRSIHIEDNLSGPVTYEMLIAAIDKHPAKLPVKHNTLKFLVDEGGKNPESMVNFANQTKPLMTAKAIKLMFDFLDFKLNHGSAIERQLYREMTLDSFINRLLVKRPFTFMGAEDLYLLRNGQNGYGGFEAIGSADERAPLLLSDYLSYDEMQLSALLVVATPSFFINSGNKTNRGKPAEIGTFQDSGVIIGTVGTRCEVKGRNEYSHMLISKNQNTAEKGYGKLGHVQAKKALEYFAKFYQQGDKQEHFFPSYEEALSDKKGRYIPLKDGKFINRTVYKQRIRAVIEPFLVAANDYAKQEGQEAYVDASRIGLGVWAVDAEVQTPLQLEVYAEIISEVPLPWISDIHFGRFHDNVQSLFETVLRQLDIGKQGNHVRFHYDAREPASMLSANDSDKLLVTNYAWDGNSYPGNEFWLGTRYLSASSDPAAACFSQIAELQNPLINPKVCGQNTYISLDGNLIPVQQLKGLRLAASYDESMAVIRESTSSLKAKKRI